MKAGTFEDAYAAHVQAAGAVGVSSGTAAIELALRALGVGEWDEVITTAHTFIATAEAISNVGAVPVFADIDPATFNIDPNHVEDARHRADQGDPRGPSLRPSGRPDAP